MSAILKALLIMAICSSCSPEARKSRIAKRAEDYFKAGEYDKAKIEYLNVIRLDPQNATAFQRVGIMWLEQGAPLRAAPFLLKARELVPNDLTNRIKLARAFLGVGDVAQARKEGIAILQEFPTSDDALLILAETNRNQQDAEYTHQQLQKFRDRETATTCLVSANLNLQKKDFLSAESALHRALALNPKSPLPHLAMATLYLLQTKPEQADPEFKIAAELAPVRSDAPLRYAEFKARTGKVDEAKVILKKITDKTPDYLPAWRVSAQIALVQKNFDESLRLIENVLTRDASNIEAKLLQAQVWLAKGETAKARDSLESLDKAYPNVPLIKYQLALAYVQANNLPQAIGALNQAVTANPEYVEALLLLSQLNLRNGKAEAAVQAMLDLLKKHPHFIPAQVLLADAYRLLGRLDDAARVIADQIKASPQNSQAHFFLGVILREQRKPEEARTAFEKAQELSPQHLAALNQLVELDIASKNFGNASHRIQRYLEISPKTAEVHLLEAKIHIAQRDWDRAEHTLLRALDLNPNLSNGYELLVSVYVSANQLSKAVSQLESLLTKNPGNIRGLMASAMIYEKTNDFNKARDAYEKLLSKNPDFAPALNNLAYLYAERLNQLDKADELARRARKVQPADAAIADTLGWIAYRRGEYQEALSLLQESATKVPDEPEIQFHLGMANYMMAQKDAARVAFQRALATAKDFPGKAESQRRLALLENTSTDPHAASIEDAKAWSKQQPNNPSVWIRLGELYEQQGMFAEGAAAYEEALKLNSKLPSATIKLAQLSAGPLKQSEKALALAKQARELAPNDPKVAGLLGKVAYQVRNLPWAYSLLQESARQLPEDAEILFDYAWVAYGLGKVSEAQQAMRKVLSTTSIGANQLKDVAKSFLEMTSADENGANLAAMEDEARRLLSADPNYVPALMINAAIQTQRGEKEAAADVYVRILRHYSEFAPAQKKLAAFYLDKPGGLEKAQDLAAKARKTLPDDPELGRIFAIISYKKNEFAYAIQLLEESAQKTPWDAKSLYYLGMSRLQTKDISQARKILAQALDAGLQEPLSSQAKQTLAQLPSH
jgi:tetratricopeptide (TPR) repeat protein